MVIKTQLIIVAVSPYVKSDRQSLCSTSSRELFDSVTQQVSVAQCAVWCRRLVACLRRAKTLATCCSAAVL